MAKRFSDSEKWKKPFIRSLQAPYKLLWLYILDECDHAGIWEVDFEVAEIKLGEKLDRKSAEILFSEKIIVIENKWFIADFIEFQYGKLSSVNRVHQSVIEILKKYNLLNIDNSINKVLASPLQGVKDKDKEKDKDKDKENHIENFPFEDFWQAYGKKTGRSDCEKKWGRIPDEERKKILNHIPRYVESTPDKQFRKDPETYLNGKHWEDEIIKPTLNQHGAKIGQDSNTTRIIESTGRDPGKL